MTFVAQFALALFEATFALYGQEKFSYGPANVAAVFVVCGLVMTVFQVGAVSLLAGRIREIVQIGAGLGLLGTGLALLAMVRTTVSVLALVGLLALGTALISPNITALISQRNGSRGVGAALGIQNAANSVGQTVGPLLGGALFLWRIDAPYLMTAALVFTVAVAVAWTALHSQPHGRLA